MRYLYYLQGMRCCPFVEDKVITLARRYATIAPKLRPLQKRVVAGDI
jgi:hypothetical protein